MTQLLLAAYSLRLYPCAYTHGGMARLSWPEWLVAYRNGFLGCLRHGAAVPFPAFVVRGQRGDKEMSFCDVTRLRLRAPAIWIIFFSTSLTNNFRQEGFSTIWRQTRILGSSNCPLVFYPRFRLGRHCPQIRGWALAFVVWWPYKCVNFRCLD